MNLFRKLSLTHSLSVVFCHRKRVLFSELDRTIYEIHHNTISYLRETDYGALFDMLYRISLIKNAQPTWFFVCLPKRFSLAPQSVMETNNAEVYCQSRMIHFSQFVIVQLAIEIANKLSVLR